VSALAQVTDSIADTGVLSGAQPVKTLRNQITDEEVLKGIKKVQNTNKGEVFLLIEDKAGENTAKKIVSVLQSKGQEKTAPKRSTSGTYSGWQSWRRLRKPWSKR
jgi:hypothetical protein